MSHCSSCGRYTGPYEACQYCGARQSGRITIRSVKATAVLLTSVGLFALWLAATGSQIPQVQIGQLAATANLAYVRVQGRVVQGPDFFAESGYLAFTLDDGTGETRVSAYQNESEELRLHGHIPSLGDSVSVAGTVRMRDQGPALTINAPEQLDILQPEPVERSIGSITTQDHLLRVRVRGQVWAVETPYEGLIIVTLRDLSGSIPVPIDRDLEALTGTMLPLEIGQSVQLLGTVDLYRDSPQIVPISTGDVLLLNAPVPVAHSREIGTLANSDVGKMVSIEGRVTDLVHLSSGVKFTLGHSAAEEVVVVWDDLINQMAEPLGIRPGAWLRVTGEVSLYNNEVEVIPQRAIDVQPIEARPVDTEATSAPIRDLSRSDVGELVSLEGRVTGVWSFSAGFRLTLDDGTGQIAVLLWLPTFDDMADRINLDLGSRIRVTGELDEYRQELQIVPLSGADITVVTSGMATDPATQIGDLTTADTGRRVMVGGWIIGAQHFNGGLRLQVDDGTGEVTILLWENVHQRMENPAEVEVGERVTIVGLVEQYGRVLEIVPQLPHHVRILD